MLDVRICSNFQLPISKMLQIHLFGGLRVLLDGKPVTGFYSNKSPALVAYLAVTRRAPTRDALATLLWSEMPDTDAKMNLRQCLTNLRKLLEPYLTITRDSVEFNFDAPYSLDVERFEQKLRDADLGAAVELYTGDFLDGVFVRDAPGFEEWMLAQRARLRDLAMQAMSALVSESVACGDNARGIEYATRLIALDPWREETHRELMLVLARSGQRSVALQQYEVCKRELREQMGVEPSAETTALYERIRAAGISPKHNLTPQPATFIGRTKELAHIEAALLKPECRLLTLLGVGGIGKTRLARHAAERALALGTFLNGVYFVPLTGVDSFDLLVVAMANACEFTFSGKQDPKTQLINFLREKEILLVLDNFENLRDAVSWLSQLLKSAPHVKLLVTARERLNVQWEWLIALEGLDLPKDEGGRTLAPHVAVPEVRHSHAGVKDEKTNPSFLPPPSSFASVELFVERARQVCSDFQIDEANFFSIARVCQLVEGLPLGIELAAALVQTFSVEEIAREIERGYDFLATTRRDAPERQRSLRAVFEHSWGSLDPAACAVFSKLAVFRSGFTREASEYVAGASHATLATLVDKSLVRHDVAGRYELHEVLRQYAEEKLGSLDGEIQARDLHAKYYAAFLKQREASIQSAEQSGALSEVNAEIDNVRAAWQRMVTQRRSEPIAQSMITLGYFFEIKSWFQEGATTFQSAALAFADSALESQRILYAKLLFRQMSFLIRLDCYADARTVGNICLGVLRSTGEQTELARVISNLGHIAYRLGEYTEAKQLMQESVDLNRIVGNPRTIAVALNNLGAVTLAMGEYARARQVFEECLRLKQQMGDQRSIANSLDNLGIIAREQGDLSQAKQYHQESLAIYRTLDDQRGMQTALNNLGALAFREKGYAEAERLLQESLNISRANSHRGIISGFTLARLGAVWCALGKHSDAHRALHDALDTAREINSDPLALLVLTEMSALWHAEGKDERAVEFLALVLHHPSSEQEARDRAQSLLHQIAPQPTNPVSAAVQGRGSAHKLEEVVAEILRAEYDM